MTETPDIDDTTAGCLVDGGADGFMDCLIAEVFGATASGPLVGLFIGGTIITSLYIAGDGDVVVPAVVTILLGSALVPLLPAQMVSLAYTLVIMGITAGMMVVFRRYVLRGGF